MVHETTHQPLLSTLSATVETVVDEDVRSLEIAMQNALAVQIRHTLGDLMHHLERVDGCVGRETS